MGEAREESEGYLGRVSGRLDTRGGVKERDDCGAPAGKEGRVIRGEDGADRWVPPVSVSEGLSRGASVQRESESVRGWAICGSLRVGWIAGLRPS